MESMLLETIPRQRIQILAPESDELPFVPMDSRTELAERLDKLIEHPFWFFLFTISLGILLAASLRYYSKPLRFQHVEKPSIADHFRPSPLLIHDPATDQEGEKSLHPPRLDTSDSHEPALVQPSIELAHLPQVPLKTTDSVTSVNKDAAENAELDRLMLQLKNLDQILGDKPVMNSARPEQGQSHAAA